MVINFLYIYIYIYALSHAHGSWVRTKWIIYMWEGTKQDFKTRF